ncbi:MAG: hypothetical protein ABSB40_06135 [Nitrososphaeria archaeon]
MNIQSKISASSYNLTIIVGSSGSSTIKATSLNELSGTVSLSASVPAGWSASLISYLVTVPSIGYASSTLSIKFSLPPTLEYTTSQ